MSFRRVWGLAAAVAIGAGVVAACGDTTNVTNIVGPGGDGGAEAAPDAGSAGDGALDDASVDSAVGDAGYEGPGCANDRSRTSDSCQIIRRCTSGECSATDSVLYQCLDSGGGSRAPIDGCNRLEPVGFAEQWCCPATCIPIPNDDFCLLSEKAMACPRIDDGGPTVPPPAGCHMSTAGGAMQATLNAVCCPL